MPTKVIIGLQWGDEGKGKVVDNLVHHWADVCVRYQGGPNAGHTIYDNEGNKHVTHALPSGVLKKDCINIIAKGCVIDAISLSEEISHYPDAQLFISDQCPLILPHHIIWDRFKYQGKIGTTAKGIGPAYSEYIARDNKTLFDLCYNFNDVIEYTLKNLREISTQENQTDFLNIFNNYLKSDKFNVDESDTEENISHCIDTFFEQDYIPRLKSIASSLKKYMTNTDQKILELYTTQRNIVLEGAQGWGLDVWGRSYPNVTSSSPNIGGVLTTTGLNHKQIDEVIGIVKIYKSKVGEGLHNTESHFEDHVYDSDEIRQKLGEFGATTGRPRRLGWLNLDEVKAACQTNGVNRIVITRLDSMPVFINSLNTFYVLHDREYLQYQNWLARELFESDEEFLNQEEIQFFLKEFKEFTGISNVSLSYGPGRSQLKW